MKLRSALCLVVCAASAAWTSLAQPDVRASADWERLEVGPVLFFAAKEVHATSPLFAPPEDPASTPSTVTAQGTYTRTFDAPTLSFVVSYGPAETDFGAGLGDAGSSSVPSFRAHYEDIGGKRARVEAFHRNFKNGDLRWENWRYIYFDDTGKLNMHLSVMASCDEPEGCREVETIFRTIRFK